jgi:hypothetical protein
MKFDKQNPTFIKATIFIILLIVSYLFMNILVWYAVYSKLCGCPGGCGGTDLRLGFMIMCDCLCYEVFGILVPSNYSELVGYTALLLRTVFPTILTIIGTIAASMFIYPKSKTKLNK